MFHEFSVFFKLFATVVFAFHFIFVNFSFFFWNPIKNASLADPLNL